MDIKHLETQYLKAKVAYYDGTPIMSDAAFDVLEQELKAAGSKVIEQVGAKRKDFDFPHPTPMKSLAKIQTSSTKGITDYQENIFINWFNKRNKQLSNSINQIYCMPKFDGSAVNIIYRDGKFESILTRGDGKFGKDASDRFRRFLPQTISVKGIVQIRCEAVMRKSTFEKKYSHEFANARNIVAGIIGKDDIDFTKISDLTLIPVHYLIDGKHQDITKVSDIMSKNELLNFIYPICLPATIEGYLSMVKYWEEKRESFSFQLDGLVFSLPVETREFLGENDHDPEWSIAIKFVPDEVVTTVEGVEWNLGKTGEFTPVIKLKPVQLAGTTVKRASGYNAGYIIKNNIGVGALVSIIKSGDIIPEIQKVITETIETFVLPSQCPSCKSKLKFDGIHLYCDNDECKGKVAKKLASACGMLDLKGIAGKTIEPFAEDYDNMFDLFVAVQNGSYRKEFNIEKYGIKYDSRSHQIFQAAFMNIKSLTYAQVILMMGYDGVGRKLSEQVAREYCGLEPDYKGHEKALVEMFKREDIKSYILNAVSVLEHLGVSIDKPKVKANNDTIYVCMTGSPKDFGYKTKEEFISQFPNVEEVSVTDAKCNYLITDDLNSTSGKMKAAKKRGVKILTYEQFKAQ